MTGIFYLEDSLNVVTVATENFPNRFYSTGEFQKTGLEFSGFWTLRKRCDGSGGGTNFLKGEGGQNGRDYQRDY